MITHSFQYRNTYFQILPSNHGCWSVTADKTKFARSLRRDAVHEKVRFQLRRSDIIDGLSGTDAEAAHSRKVIYTQSQDAFRQIDSCKR